MQRRISIRLSRKRKYVETLRRRADWLDVKVRVGDGSPKSLSRDRSERAALRWALETIRMEHSEIFEPIRNGELEEVASCQK